MSTIPTKFEVDMTIHCRVIAFLSVGTSRDFVTLTFDLLTLNICCAWRVKFEDRTPISSWFMSYNVSRWLPLRMRTRPLRMRRITWPVSHVTLWPWPLIFDLEQLSCMAFLSVGTSRDCDLDFWPFDFEQLLCMAGHVANFATKYEDPTIIRSWVTSYNVSHWLPLKMRTRPLHMCRITWSMSRRWKTITFLEPPTPICLFIIQLRWLYNEYN